MSTPFERTLRPTISPDGRWLAYTASVEGPTTMWVQPVEGGQPRQLTSEESSWNQWSPDDRELYFKRENQLWAVSFEDGVERPLTHFQGRLGVLKNYFDSDGEYMYFLWREDLGDIWVMDVIQD